MYNNNHVNDAGAFLVSSPSTLLSTFPNQRDDVVQHSYQPYAHVCASTIDTAAAHTNPSAPTPSNPTTGIIAYRDLFSMGAEERNTFVAKGGVRDSFPIKLFKMLEHIDLHEPELANIVSWQPDGCSFLVHGNTKTMEEQILPRYFKGQKHYASFSKQLNLWGFRRFNKKGEDSSGAYYHTMFLRDKPHLCRDISLVAQKQGSSRNSHRYDLTWANVEEHVEPRFNTCPVLAPAGESLAPGAAEQVGETSNSASSFPSSSRPWVSWLSEEGGEKVTASDQSQADSTLFTLKNHYSAVDLEPFSGSPPQMTQKETYQNLLSMGAVERNPFVAKGILPEPFPIKLFKMLEHIDLHEPELAKIVSWQPDGRSFLVHSDTKTMEEQILPRFFKGQTQYASFRRQLNLRGFRRVNGAANGCAANGAYYHTMFLRGKPHLCRDISLVAQKQGSSSRNSHRYYCSTWANVEEHVEPRFSTRPALAPAGESLAPGAAEQVGETSNSASSFPSSSRPWVSWLSKEGGEKVTASDQSQADSTVFTLKNHYSAVDLEPFSGSPPQMTQEETRNMFDFLKKLNRL